MRSIKEIMDACKIVTSGDPYWCHEELEEIVKEYAKEVLDYLVENANEYIYVSIDKGGNDVEALFNYEQMENLKQNLK